MRFGDFLVTEGRVHDDQVALALAEQRRRQIPLGLLAIHSGQLDAAGVHRILRAQSHRRSWQRFGDLAIELGMLGQGDVDGLLRRQAGSRPKLGELLVEQGALAAEELRPLLEEHHRNHLVTSGSYSLATA